MMYLKDSGKRTKSLKSPGLDTNEEKICTYTAIHALPAITRLPRTLGLWNRKLEVRLRLRFHYLKIFDSDSSSIEPSMPSSRSGSVGVSL